MLDADLAELYGVETRALIQAVKRNQARFPEDFMFQLNATEIARLRSQTVMANVPGRGGRRNAPYAFTEQGVAMLSGVLRSSRAIAVHIEIMRAFVRLRHVLASNRDLARRFDELEQRLARKLTNHDEPAPAEFYAARARRPCSHFAAPTTSTIPMVGAAQPSQGALASTHGPIAASSTMSSPAM